MIGQIGYAELMQAARRPDDAATLAFAGTIALAPQRASPYDVAIAGLDAGALAGVARTYFPDLAASLDPDGRRESPAGRADEFQDLLGLLLAARSSSDVEVEWLAHAVATACMGENHLWQDLGLPDRTMLTELLDRYFPSLAKRNTKNMRWKKFFYRELCREAEVTLCKSPSCGVCGDYDRCFGPENGMPVHASPTAMDAPSPWAAPGALTGH